MKKIILFCRVSTTVQTYDEQLDELIKFCKSDGYTEDEMVIIKEAGASAIKLNDLYLNMINNIQEVITENKGIEAVYLWSLDRFGRDDSILINMKNWFIKNKINLIIKNPCLILLNKDKTVNNGTEITYNVLAAVAKQEMQMKFDRFKRSKDANKRNNLYNGGKIPVGYKVGKNKEFEIDENEFITELFTMYASGNYSHLDLAKHFQSKGYLTDTKIYFVRQRITDILHNEVYIGKPSKNGYVYPRIISDELFYKCNALCNEKANRKGRNSKKLNTKEYLCRGILRTDDNEPMSVHVIVQSYISFNSKTNIKTDILDKSIWFMLCPILTMYNANKRTDIIESNEKDIADLNKKIETSNNNIIEYKSRIDVLDDSFFVNGRITKEKYLKMTDALRNKIEEENKNISIYNERIKSLSMMFSPDTKIIDVNNIYSINDNATKYDLIREIVSNIVIYKTDKRYIKKVEVTFNHMSTKLVYNINTYLKQIITDDKVITKEEFYL